MSSSLNDIRAAQLNRNISELLQLEGSERVERLSGGVAPDALMRQINQITKELSLACSANPNLPLELALWNCLRPCNEDSVRALCELRHFIFFYTQAMDKGPDSTDLTKIKVSRKAFELQLVIDTGVPWGPVGDSKAYIPLKDWLDVAQEGFSLIRQFIEGPYQSWPEIESFRDVHGRVFLNRARILQEDPSYKAILQLKHTVDQF